MKKIILFIPFLAIAGAEVMVRDLAEQLHENNKEVVVASLYDFNSEITEELHKAGIRIVYLHKKRGLDVGLTFRVAQLIKKEKPDVVHTHLNVVKYVMPGSVFFRIPVRIHTVHNIAEKEQGWIDRKTTRFFAKKYNLRLVGISPQIKNSILNEYNLKGVDVPMIYNGRNLDMFRVKDNYAINNDIRILHIGRFALQKNHKLLIQSFAKVSRNNPHLKLVLVGEGELKEEIRILVHELDMDDKVEFLGLRYDINEIMYESDMFVLPSLYEGMPITLIEAMASGLPIVASDVGGVPDMIKNGKEGLLITPNEEELINAMGDLVESEKLRKELGMSAARKAAAFSAKNMVNKYLDLYENRDCVYET